MGKWILGNMEHALLDHDNGSRILATTRNEDVANFSRGSSLVHVYRIEPSTQKGAWELFCNKAFRFEFKGQCPKDLEGLSRDIVRRCGGLPPLAIVAVSGLLATKEKTVLEWKKALRGLRGSAMVSDPYIDNVTNILSLSYGDLHYHLQSCFLYFGMCPEDFPIKLGRIIQLWVAGGFVQEKPGMTLEEVGEEYFIELIRRSLVQVDKVSLKGTPKTCRVHDLVHDVILSKSKEPSLCHVSSSFSTFEGIGRHLSISNRGSNTPNSITKSQTRSVIACNEVKLQKATMSVIFAKFKLLTTLDFDNCPIDRLPKKIFKLKRYQSSKTSKINKKAS
jgi:disease resistance protein RPM1